MTAGRKRTLVAGAIALAAAGAVTRGIGAVYHIIVARMVGAEVLGLFQMALPLYRLASGAALLGFHIAVVSRIADSLGRSRPDEAREYARAALAAASFSGLAAGALVWVGAPLMVPLLFDDVRLVLAIRCLGLLLVPSTITAVLRGILRGFGGAVAVAGANVAEAVFRVPSVLAMLVAFLPFGAGAAAAAMVCGMVVGELGSLAILGLRVRPLMAGGGGAGRRSSISSGRYTRDLLRLGLPAMVSVMLNSIMSVVNAALVPRQLQAAGLTQSEAAQAFGEVTGMVAPMLYFPMMAIGPIIQVVTPAVAERMGAKQYGRVADLLRKAFFIAGAVGAVFSAVLFLVPGLIGRVLYGAPHIAPLVRPLSVAAPFVYLGMVCSGVLHGLGQMAPVTANVFAGNVARCVLICTLVSRPGWGAAVAVWAMVADHVVTAVLNIACLGWFMGLAKLGLGFSTERRSRSGCTPPSGGAPAVVLLPMEENLRRGPCSAPSTSLLRVRS